MNPLTSSLSTFPSAQMHTCAYTHTETQILRFTYINKYAKAPKEQKACQVLTTVSWEAGALLPTRFGLDKLFPLSSLKGWV